jgi:hypothetical protein
MSGFPYPHRGLAREGLRVCVRLPPRQPGVLPRGGCPHLPRDIYLELLCSSARLLFALLCLNPVCSTLLCTSPVFVALFVCSWFSVLSGFSGLLCLNLHKSVILFCFCWFSGLQSRGSRARQSRSVPSRAATAKLQQHQRDSRSSAICSTTNCFVIGLCVCFQCCAL